MITVADGGAGVDPDVLERIFERFARADVSRTRREGGVGLGLAIVAAIASAHDGSCAARTSRTAGPCSSFDCRSETLPMQTQPRNQVHRSPRTTRPRSRPVNPLNPSNLRKETQELPRPLTGPR